LLKGATVTRWSREALRDQNEKAIFPEVKLQWVRYRRSQDEISLLERLKESLQRLPLSNQWTQASVLSLLSSASSSFFALEQNLRRLEETITEINENDGLGRRAWIQSLPSDTRPDALADRIESLEDVATIAVEFLPLLEGFDRDSKLSTIDELCFALMKQSDTARVCILTNWADTADLVELVLRDRHPRVSTLSLNTRLDERDQLIREFSEKGGILLLTELISRSVPESTAVVFYDVPMNASLLDATLAQFVRVGRQEPVTVYSFVDESETLLIEQVHGKLLELAALGQGERPSMFTVIEDALGEEAVRRLLSLKGGDKTA
jgi:SNF2 family DNA or RNA helicase